MAQANENPLSHFLASALTAETIKNRNRLVLMCVVGFLFWKFDLKPSEFAPLGITFKSDDVEKLPIAIFCLHLYFLLIFSLYCIADSLNWLSKIWQTRLWDEENFKSNFRPPNRNNVWPKPTRWLGFFSPRYLDLLFLAGGLARFTLDIIFPFCAGSYIAFQLYFKST